MLEAKQQGKYNLFFEGRKSQIVFVIRGGIGWVGITRIGWGVMGLGH